MAAVYTWSDAYHTEIRQGQALQAIQFNPRGILQGMYARALRTDPVSQAAHIHQQCNWQVTEQPPPVLGNKPKSVDPNTSGKPVTISYLTEQTSHHPPVSAYYIDCPEKGITGQGFDQISVNFTGTRVRVAPGEHNGGIYITLHNQGGETYNLTHPVAHLGGLLRGRHTRLYIL